MSDVFNLYNTNPAFYDEHKSTELETRNFDEVFNQIQKASDKKDITHILDLCCGTGFFARKWLSKTRRGEINYVGIDINSDFIKYANEQDKPTSLYRYYLVGNPVTTKFKHQHDIVMGTSAYHHIQDEKKVAFLNNMKRNMTPEGTGIIYEKFIAQSGDLFLETMSGMRFYEKRILYMKQHEKLSENQLSALYNELYLTAERIDDYKVSYKRFTEDMQEAGLKIIDKIKIWPKEKGLANKRVGDFVIVFKKQSQ